MQQTTEADGIFRLFFAGALWDNKKDRHVRLISMRIIPASGNKESCLGPIFRPFTYSDQYSLQVLLCRTLVKNA